jgi:hypothetical protein
MLNEGKDLEFILGFLRKSGCSKTQSIIILKEIVINWRRDQIIVEGRRKKEEGRRKREEGRKNTQLLDFL